MRSLNFLIFNRFPGEQEDRLQIHCIDRVEMYHFSPDCQVPDSTFPRFFFTRVPSREDPIFTKAGSILSEKASYRHEEAFGNPEEFL